MPRNIHLLCNAHLDPVWLWEWEEGAAEAISTFRTAAELCETNAAFIFNHNEATLYQWVQEHEPELFERIRKLVRQGRWHIMGSWYLQQDCNMPSGESFVRQIMMGKRYFKRHFGVDVKTAINFDPFGHTRGLVQILAKSGYDSYLFGRPDQKDCPLPADDFVWVGYDGSEVMATRFSGWYNSKLGQARRKIEQWLEDYPDRKIGLVLWGVGNHGGGPSRADLRAVDRLIARRKDVAIFHSTPDAYFKELKRGRARLPRHAKDLNPWGTGCYTSLIRIKQKHRLLENEIYALEKMASTAAANGLMEYPRAELAEAFHDLLSGQFHDILPGSSIQPAEEAALRMYDHGLEIVARLKARAFFRLARGQRRARPDTIPIMVYNPHPYPVRALVECEFNLPDFRGLGDFTRIHVHTGGRELPAQVEQELSNVPVEWRKRIVFPAELAPGRMSRFDCTMEPLPSKPPLRLRARGGKIVFTTKDLQVIVNTRTGLIDRYRAGGVDYVARGAFQLLVIRDNADSWGMLKKAYRSVAGRFTLMDAEAGSRFSGIEHKLIPSVRVIEDGPARAVVEAVFAWGHSRVCQRYKLPKAGTEIEVETRVQWAEKDRMLKLAVPLAGDYAACRFLGQVAFGTDDLPAGGKEAVAQKWVAAADTARKTAFTVINGGTYASDFSPDGLRLTLLRSPAYACHPWENRIFLADDRFSARQDQGERVFRFWCNGGPAAERLACVDREAQARNEAPVALSFFPSGLGRAPKPIAVLADRTVVVSAVKKAEDGEDFIVRLFEPTGRKRTTRLSMPALGARAKVALEPFEIKTLRIGPKPRKVREVDLMERPIC